MRSIFCEHINIMLPPNMVMLPLVLFGQALLHQVGETSAFLPPPPLPRVGNVVASSSSSSRQVRLKTATNDVVDVVTDEESLLERTASLDKHAVIGSTHLNPRPRNLDEFPSLRDAYLSNTHPELTEDEVGLGAFIMSDWRKAWHTYGQCDAEYERRRSIGIKGSHNDEDEWVDPLTGEAEYEVDEIDGELPDDLVGVLYRNGPGKFGVNGERVAHILDADGLVLRFEFRPPEDVEAETGTTASSSGSSSRVKFTSRFVETEGFLEERDAKKFTKRGTFGTAPRGLTSLFGGPARDGLNEDPEEKPPLLARVSANAFKVDIKNTANTQVVAFGGKVLALWEAGMPYSLDPVTLETIGVDDLGLDVRGTLAVNLLPGLPEEVQPSMLGGKAHTAHPKVCPRTGHLVGWSWAQNPADGSMEVTVTEYDPDGFRAVASETHIMEDCALTPHDMVLTENYIVLKINSLSMNKLSFLSGAEGPAECLGMDGRAPVRAFVFPRPTTLSSSDKTDDDGRFAPFLVDDIPACFSIHFSHGYEDEKTGNIVSYFSGWPPSDSKTFLGAWGGFCPDYDKIPPTYLWRMELDTETKQCVDLRVSPGAENICCEHPVVHPNFQTRDATYAYAQCCNAVGDASAPQGYARLVLDGSSRAQPELAVGDRNDLVDVYWLGPRRFAGEPLVVPKRNGNPERETDAYLLGLVYDAVEDRSSLMVFDLERELREGPVCTVWLKSALPHGLHGCFAPDASVKTSYFC